MDYRNSVLAGLAGGVVSGVLLTITGSMVTMAQLLGSTSMVLGWIAHLVLGAILGVVYAAVWGRIVGDRMNTLGSGLLYGFIWYLLAPLTLLPLFLGMGVQWSGVGISESVDALVAYLLFGLVLSWAYERLSGRASSGVTASQ